MVLNSLRIDPMRTWKGVWRWFNEQNLACCTGPVPRPEGRSMWDGLGLGSGGGGVEFGRSCGCLTLKGRLAQAQVASQVTSPATPGRTRGSLAHAQNDQSSSGIVSRYSSNKLGAASLSGWPVKVCPPSFAHVQPAMGSQPMAFLAMLRPPQKMPRLSLMRSWPGKVPGSSVLFHKSNVNLYSCMAQTQMFCSFLGKLN